MRQVTTKSGKTIWVTEWTTEGSACQHGTPVPYRWVNAERDEEADSEPEYGSYDCRKCHEARDKAIEAMRRGDWETADYWRSQTGYGV